jgi:hypothetical protein
VLFGLNDGRLPRTGAYDAAAWTVPTENLIRDRSGIDTGTKERFIWM